MLPVRGLIIVEHPGPQGDRRQFRSAEIMGLLSFLP